MIFLVLVLLQPDVVTFNTAIRACANEGRIETAKKLLALMSKEDITPNTVTYNAVIRTCIKSGERHVALAVFHQMQQQVQVGELCQVNHFSYWFLQALTRFFFQWCFI